MKIREIPFLAATIIFVAAVTTPVCADSGSNDRLGLNDVFYNLLSEPNSLDIANRPFCQGDEDCSCNLAPYAYEGSYVPATLNKHVLYSDAMLYQARFNLTIEGVGYVNNECDITWRGDLAAYNISDGSSKICPKPRGELCENTSWNISFPEADQRIIITNRRDAFLTLPNLTSILEALRSNTFNCDGWWIFDSVCDLLNDVVEQTVMPLVDFLDAAALKPLTSKLESLLGQFGALHPNDDAAPFRVNSLGLEQHLFLGLLGETTSGLLSCAPLNTVKNILGGRAVKYLRGGVTCNGNTVNMLGDILHSGPVYVGRPSFFYTSGSYAHFVEERKNRTPMIYVGANDGMLHAFDASNGKENLAFLPAAVYPKLYELTTEGYNHKYFVDDGLTVGDAYFQGKWHTVLVGTLGAGGQSVFALDITDPSNFREDHASDILLWEFMDADDIDLGYVYGQPSIVRVHTSSNTTKWVAVFGNGFDNTDNLLGRIIDSLRNGSLTKTLLNSLAVLLTPDIARSTTGNAVLYIVDIATGDLIAKIDTGIGTADDPSAIATGHPRPNGLGEVTVSDFDGDGVADAVYAGDLFGNLWKFDLTGGKAQWEVGNSGTPLFTATIGNAPQPIVSSPMVPRAPTKSGGQLVIFGTGKNFEANDNITTNLQTLYAVYDDNGSAGSTLTRPDLVKQTVEQTVENTRITTQKSISNWGGYKGWYIDLKSSGERIIAPPAIRGRRVFFTTIVPSSSSLGGYSWLYALNYVTGSRPSQPILDITDDDKIDIEDLVELSINGNSQQVAPSALKFSEIISTPKIQLDPKDNKVRLYISGSDGGVQVITTRADLGRKDWRQLR